jgi:peptidoglycan/LPS O-acetylase OafA/YrhL
LTLEPILFALLITSTLLNATHWAFRWMESSSLTFLGRISYSIYIWQQLFTVKMDHVSAFGRLFALPISLIWIIPVAALSYRYIELPGIRCGKWLIDLLDHKKRAMKKAQISDAPLSPPA